MIYRNIIIIILFLISTQNLHCQTSEDDDQKKVLGPAKAAFYSAVLPGLGQVYNKKYWKVPIVYGGLAAGLYFFNKNNDLYNDYRHAYKRRLAGFTDDEFYGDGSVPEISNDALIRAQKALKRNKELSVLVIIGTYALNIIDANVDAHLLQYNLNDNLSLSPKLEFNQINYSSNLSLALKLEL